MMRMKNNPFQSLFRRPRLRAALLALLVSILLLAVELIGWLPGVTTPIEKFELASGDQLFRLRGRLPVDAPVKLVAIDDFSFSWSGLAWPWPRDYLAKIVSALNQDGAAVIGLDILLTDPSANPQADKTLALAIRQAGNVVSIGQIVEDAELHTQSLIEPLPFFQDAGLRWGLAGIFRDEDVVARRILVSDHFLEGEYRHWGFELARAYWGSSAPAHLSVPLAESAGQQDSTLINYPGPKDTFEHISAALVAENRFPPGTFRGKIVLVGPTTESLHDTYATPFSSEALTPGVEIGAATVWMILSGSYLQAAPPWFGSALILACLLLAWLGARILPASKILWSSLELTLGYLLLWVYLFIGWRIQIPLAMPGLSILLTIGLPAADNLLARQLRFRRVNAQLIPLLTTAGDLETLTGWLIPVLAEHFQFASLEILVRNPKGDQLIPTQSKEVGQVGLAVIDPVLGIFADSRPQSDPSAPIFATLIEKFPNLGADMLFPLRNADSLLALLCLRFSAGVDRDSELELLKMLSGPLTLSFENAYLVEKSKKQARTTHELEIARKIQLSFLPESFPQSTDFQIAAYYMPARQVGGDFYDVISLPDGGLALVMADVSDKGVPAALFMALSRSYVRVYSNPKGRAFQMASLESILQAVNDSLAEGNPSSMFVTLFYGLLDVHNRSLRYINAGHNPPLLVKPGLQPEFISGGGTALGVFEGLGFEEYHLDLERGQAMLFYTDGVTEARNPQDELYGEERLVQSAGACVDLDAEGIVEHIRHDLEVFVADAPQADDITLMVLKV